MAIFGFDETTKEMEVRSLHPGVKLAMLRERMGWEPRVSAILSETVPPSDFELAAIRSQPIA
jgi:acyl CoA:acetate/3-ketoacid CoA transferase beta subunit